MNCPRCGGENGHGAFTCRFCGNSLRPDGTNYAKQPRAVFEKMVRSELKRQARSVLLMIAVVLYTLAMILRLIDGFSVETTALLGAHYSIDDTWTMAVSIVSLTPGLLAVVGFWLLFAGSFSQGKGISIAGLKLLFVSEIIHIVYMGLLLLVFSGAILPACGSMRGLGDQAMVAISTVFAIVIFFIVVSAKTLMALRTIQITIRESVPNSDISGMIGVVSIIMGAVSLLTLISELSWDTVMMSAVQVMLGIQLFTYKGVMSDLEKQSVCFESPAKSSIIRNPTTAGQVQPQGYLPAWKRVQMEEAAKHQDDAE